MSALEFGTRTGDIDFIDFDEGVVEGLGAVIDPNKNQYYIDLRDACGRSIFATPPNSNAPVEITRAAVLAKQSEPTRDEFDLPAIIWSLDDASVADSRIWSPPPLEYRVPAEGATRVSIGACLGWDCYETKEKAWPYDYTYTFECWSRHRAVAKVLLQIVMKRYPRFGSVTVRDSLGIERVYHTFQEGTADLTEVNSLVDRLVGYSLSVRVEGEATLDREAKIDRVFTGTTRPPGNPGDPSGPTDPTGPFDPNSPDPGPGGLYGDGRPMKRVTATGSDE